MKVVRQIQYQVAKLEVLENLLPLTGESNPQDSTLQSNLEVELAQGVLTRVRESLYDACDGYLDCPPEKLNFYRTRLTSTILSAQVYLSQVLEQLTGQEPQLLRCKELIVGVITEILDLVKHLTAPRHSRPLLSPAVSPSPAPAAPLQLALTPVAMWVDFTPRRVDLELEIIC